MYLEFVAFRRSMMPGLRRPADMFDNFTGDLRWMTANVGHGVYNVVFHPQVIGRGHRLLALEAWLDDIAELGLTFARLDDSPPPTSPAAASASSPGRTDLSRAARILGRMRAKS